jgi:phosphate starvation-inducible PhoH-like protein
VVLDEAQNTTPEQMKMFLTRLGFGSKAIVTGDPSQTDLPRGLRSGLGDALELLSDIRGIGVSRFTDTDVVRHPLVADIVRAYDARDRIRAQYRDAREGRGADGGGRDAEAASTPAGTGTGSALD